MEEIVVRAEKLGNKLLALNESIFNEVVGVGVIEDVEETGNSKVWEGKVQEGRGKHGWDSDLKGEVVGEARRDTYGVELGEVANGVDCGGVLVGKEEYVVLEAGVVSDFADETLTPITLK